MSSFEYLKSFKMQKLKVDWASSLSGFIFVFAIPPIHIFVLWFFWKDYSRRVEKSSCTCSCWDTVFKGPYESGVASYKHFYFNSTLNTLKVWFLLVSHLVALHECVKWLVTLWLTSRLRTLMAVLFFSSLFSHYYSWWMYTNYYNDEFYDQWYHQLFFSVTELISTSVVLWLCTRDHRITPTLAGFIALISFIHVVISSKDQFLVNVFRRQGEAHQVIRDIGLMIPDLMHITIPFICLRGRKWR